MWFELSLFFALWTSIGILILKKLTADYRPVHLAVLGNLFTIPFVFLILLYLKFPAVGIDFYKFIFTSAVLDSIAAITYYKALTSSPISLLSPISSFNPIFTLFFALLFLHENPTPLKFLGIIVIVIGSYLLNIKDIKSGLLKPFTNLFSNKGVQLFLISNLIWGFTPILQKPAIFQTHPQTPLFPVLVGSILATVFLIPLAIKDKIHKVPIGKNIKWFLIIGPMTALAGLAAFTAFSLTNVAYVTAVFKLSTLFSVILGALFLKEKRISERLLGATVMLIGTIILAI